MKRKDVRARTALVATALGVSLAITLAREAPAGGKEPSTAAYGSGNHGEWISDDFGLQAYRYTGCTAARAPCVATDDAVHQLGNDGVTALAHSGGYVELYSTRSYHRFANRYDASKQAFAGGFGWVRDGRTTWSMLYADRPEGASYERVFGMGYFEKTIEHSGLGVVHDVYMTEGDDAVLREHLVFTNRTPFSKSITYFDYWDVAWWHPRIINGSTAASSYDTATVKTRYDARLGALFATSQAAPRDVAVPDLLVDPVPQVSSVLHREGAPPSPSRAGAFEGGSTRRGRSRTKPRSSLRRKASPSRQARATLSTSRSASRHAEKSARSSRSSAPSPPIPSPASRRVGRSGFRASASATRRGSGVKWLVRPHGVLANGIPTPFDVRGDFASFRLAETAAATSYWALF